MTRCLGLRELPDIHYTRCSRCGDVDSRLPGEYFPCIMCGGRMYRINRNEFETIFHEPCVSGEMLCASYARRQKMGIRFPEPEEAAP